MGAPIHEVLREVRKRAGLTIAEVAAKINGGLCRQTVGHYETAARDVPSDRIDQIADVCGVHITATGKGWVWTDAKANAKPPRPRR
jgi:transcriptional regulator with XRE-family HTH domain